MDAFGLVGGDQAPGIFEGDVLGEAGVVGEELADGDFFFAIGGEFGEVFGDRVVELELACLIELHDGGGGRKALRQRGHVEDGVFGHEFGVCLAVDAGFSDQFS